MGASNANPGYGTTLAISDGATPPIYTDIAEVVSMAGPSITREAIDVTHLKSDGMCKEFIAGIIDSGELSLDLNNLPDDSSQSGIFDDIIETTPANATQDYRMLFPDHFDRSFEFTVNAGSDIGLSASHGLLTPQKVQFTTDDTLPDPLALLTDYWIRVETVDVTFSIYPTKADALAETNKIDIIDGGAGTHTLWCQDSFAFSAQPTVHESSASVTDKLALSVTMKLTGAITSTF